MNLDFSIQPFQYVLLKVAAACNLKCPYCYWFRDISVYNKPKVMPLIVEDSFILKLKNHLNSFKIDQFKVLIHGGEPTLLGKERFETLCSKIKNVSYETKTEIQISITTNAVLIDEQWVSIFKKYNISVTISLDGPKKIHDKNRINFGNKGTFHLTI